MVVRGGDGVAKVGGDGGLGGGGLLGGVGERGYELFDRLAHRRRRILNRLLGGFGGGGGGVGDLFDLGGGLGTLGVRLGRKRRRRRRGMPARSDPGRMGGGGGHIVRERLAASWRRARQAVAVA